MSELNYRDEDGRPLSQVIRDRLNKNNKRFWAGDNISEYVSDVEKDSLFKYWDEKDKLLLITDSNSEAINDLRKKYITFCADSISQFFYAVKSTHNEYWVYDKPCKLLTVTSIVAFMKSYEFSIGLFKGIKDIEFYSKKLKNMNFNFKMEPFPYVSSQWNKLSEEINKCWD